MSTLAQPERPYRTPPAVRRLLLVLASLLAVLLVAITTVNLLDLASRHTSEQVATYTDVRSLEIDDASDIRLTSAPAGAPLQVRARVTEGLRSPDRDIERGADGSLRLSSSCPLLFGNSCDVDYEVRVPSGTLVRADASAGDIVAEDIVTSVPLELESSAGDVTAIDVSAPELRLASSAGDVEGRGIRAQRVSAQSSAGDVVLSLLSPAARVDAESSAGDVGLVVPDAVYRVDASTSAGDVYDRGIQTDPASSRAISAHSSAGDIRIEARR